MKKRFLAGILALVMLLTLCPVSVLAAGEDSAVISQTTVYGNGFPLLIEAGADGGTTVRYDSDKNAPYDYETTLTENNTEELTIYAGSKETVINTASVRMTGGKVSAIYGGGYAENNGASVGNSSITIDGGTVENIYGGGYGYGNTVQEHMIDKVTEASITIRGGVVGSVYGGGRSSSPGYPGYTIVDSASISVTGGAVGKLYASAAYAVKWCENYVTSAAISVSGGTVTEIIESAGSVTRDDTINTVTVTGFVITGGSIASTDMSVVPTNGTENGGSAVQKNEIVLKDAEEANAVPDEALSALVTDMSYTYGMSDVKTDADGKIYVWLPAGTTVSGAVSASGNSYIPGSSASVLIDNGTAPLLVPLRIACNVSGADVYLDDKLIGVTPLDDYNVEAGAHTVEVALRGYTAFTGSITAGGNLSVTLQPELYPAAYADKLVTLTVDNDAVTLKSAAEQVMADTADKWYLIEFADGVDTVCLDEQLLIDRRGKMTINGEGRVAIAKTCLECAMNVICADVRLTGLTFDAANDRSDNNERSMLTLRLPEDYTDKAYHMDNIYVTNCTFTNVSEVGVGTCGSYGNAATGYNEAGTANFSNLVFSGNKFTGTSLFSFAGAGDEDYNVIDGYYICGNTFIDGGIGMLASDAHTWYVYDGTGECNEREMKFCEYNILRNVLISGNSITMTENAKYAWENIIMVSCANLGNSHSTTENVEIRHNISRITGGTKNQFSTVSINTVTVADSYEDGKHYNTHVTPGMEHTDYNSIRNVSVHDNDFQLGTGREFRVYNVMVDEGEQCGSHNTISDVRVENNRIEAQCGVRICNYSGNTDSGLCEDNTMSNIHFTGNTLSRSGTEYGDYGVMVAESCISQCGHLTDDMPQYSGTTSDITVKDNTICNFAYGVVACGAVGDYADGQALRNVTIEGNRIVNVNYRQYPIVDMGIVVAGSAFQTNGEEEGKAHLSAQNCTVSNVTVKNNDITALCGISVSGLLVTENIHYPATGNQAAGITVTGNTITKREFTSYDNQNCPGIITGDVVEVWYKLGSNSMDRLENVGGSCAEDITVSDNTATGFTVAEDIVHDFSRTQWSEAWQWLSDGQRTMAKRQSGDLWVYAYCSAIQGDVNGDDTVAITDMACLYTYLATGKNEGNLDGRIFRNAADVNGDGEVNILDYQALYVLVKKQA